MASITITLDDAIYDQFLSSFDADHDTAVAAMHQWISDTVGQRMIDHVTTTDDSIEANFAKAIQEAAKAREDAKKAIADSVKGGLSIA